MMYSVITSQAVKDIEFNSNILEGKASERRRSDRYNYYRSSSDFHGSNIPHFQLKTPSVLVETLPRGSVPFPRRLPLMTPTPTPTPIVPTITERPASYLVVQGACDLAIAWRKTRENGKIFQPHHHHHHHQKTCHYSASKHGLTPSSPRTCVNN